LKRRLGDLTVELDNLLAVLFITAAEPSKTIADSKQLLMAWLL
jgi:hypothetical protein